MGIQKWWDFSEAKRLQFRMEMFNAFNHPNFFAPDLNLSNYKPVNGVKHRELWKDKSGLSIKGCSGSVEVLLVTD